MRSRFPGRFRREPLPVPSGAGPAGHAFVLSGGGSVGAAQVGALRALFEAGVRPDLVVGCSVGALNGAFLALDPTVERVTRLANLWRSLDRATVFPSSRRSVAGHLVRRHAHLYEPDGLRDLIRRWIPAGDLSDTVVPCHVVTTDLLDGRPVWWSAGDPRQVLLASASLPGLLPPVVLGESLHVDGGVTCPVPCRRALELGLATVWVLDVTGGSLGRRDERMSALDVLLLSFAITRQQLGQATVSTTIGQSVHRLPAIDIGKQDLRDFSRTAELIELGYAAGKRMVETAAVPASGLGPARVPTPRSGSASPAQAATPAR